MNRPPTIPVATIAFVQVILLAIVYAIAIHTGDHTHAHYVAQRLP